MSVFEMCSSLIVYTRKQSKEQLLKSLELYRDL